MDDVIGLVEEQATSENSAAITMRILVLSTNYNIQIFYIPIMETENTEPTVEQADENGEILVKELAKEYLSKGAWATIAFLYQEKDKNGNFGDSKVSLRRYQKIAGVYKQRSKFNVSSKAQAEQIIEVFKKWYEL